MLMALSFVLFSIGLMTAQTQRVQGIVTSSEDGLPVIGASVLVEGTTLGDVSDIDGKFTIADVPAKSKTLIVSYVGMQAQKVAIRPGIIKVELKPDAQLLEEVVIQVAYGTAKKTSLTGAISNVDVKEIEKRPVSSVASVLEGTTTGIQVNSTYGEPGKDATIRIRGFGSVNGSNEPLYVLDGVPYNGNISDLNPTDIESISVLKDAASSALYGNRAANGVILITSKKAKSERASVNLTINQGMYTRGIPEYDRLNADSWMEAMWMGYRNGMMTDKDMSLEEASAEAGKSLIDEVVLYNIYNKANDQLFDANGKLVPDAMIREGYRGDLDWYEPVERTGYRQEYNVSAEAAREKVDARFSAGYLKEDGYVRNTGFERLTARATVNITPTKWFKAGLNIAGSHQVTNFSDDGTDSYSNPFMYARNMAPVYPVHLHDMETGEFARDENNRLIYDDGETYSRPQYAGRHVAWEMEEDHDRTYRNTLNGQLYADVKFLKDFTFSLKGDLSLRNTENRAYDNAVIGNGNGSGGRSKRNIYRYKNYTMQQQLNYNHMFDKHFVDVLAAHESYVYKRNYMYAFKSGETIPGSDEMIGFSNMESLYDYQDNYRTESYLGRVRYNYDDRYHGEVSFRRDGSSRFHPDNRWGNFWSIGGSWVISSEEFMKGVNWVDFLKLRASYGEVGNDAGVGYYGYMPLYQMDLNGGKPSLYKSQNGAKDIKWETTASFGVALEGTLFDRFNFSMEYFDKRSKDLLFDVYLPLSSGATSADDAEATITRNLGTVSNRGFEFAGDVDIIRNKDWKWNVGLNLTTVKNKIVQLPEQNRKNGIINGTKKYMEGHGIYDYWMYQYAGVDQMYGDALYFIDEENYKVDESDPNDKRGLIPESKLRKVGDKYYSLATTYAKRDWSGSAMPDLYGSFSTALTWKNLSLSALFTYSIGGKTLDYSYMSMMSMSGTPHSLHKDVMTSWNGAPEGMTEDSPNRIDPNGTPVFDFTRSSDVNATSNRFLTDASYLVIKNINLSYTFPKALIRKIDLSALTVTGSIENLATFTKRKGMNPQQSYNGTSDNLLVTPRVFTLGLNLKF